MIFYIYVFIISNIGHNIINSFILDNFLKARKLGSYGTVTLPILNSQRCKNKRLITKTNMITIDTEFKNINKEPDINEEIDFETDFIKLLQYYKNNSGMDEKYIQNKSYDEELLIKIKMNYEKFSLLKHLTSNILSINSKMELIESNKHLFNNNIFTQMKNSTMLPEMFSNDSIPKGPERPILNLQSHSLTAGGLYNDWEFTI